MNDKKNAKMEYTVSGNPLPDEAAKKVHEVLKKTLQAELKKHAATLGGVKLGEAFDVSGHGRS